MMAYSDNNIIILLVFIFLASSNVIVGGFDNRILSRICSGDLYHKGSEYDFAVSDTLDDLVANTPDSPQLDYYCQDTHKAESFYGRDVTLYGHSVCTKSLSHDDCLNCIQEARTKMFEDCTHSEGAQIQLMDCRLRYEKYKFSNDI